MRSMIKNNNKAVREPENPARPSESVISCHVNSIGLNHYVEISRLELTVIKENIKAFNLYRKMGFILKDEKVHY